MPAERPTVRVLPDSWKSPLTWQFSLAGLLVAALALLAAATGFCTGCEAYKLLCWATGKPFVSCPIPEASLPKLTLPNKT